MKALRAYLRSPAGIIGAVLLLAVIVDSLSRRTRASHGRA